VYQSLNILVTGEICIQIDATNIDIRILHILSPT